MNVMSEKNVAKQVDAISHLVDLLTTASIFPPVAFKSHITGFPTEFTKILKWLWSYRTHRRDAEKKQIQEHFSQSKKKKDKRERKRATWDILIGDKAETTIIGHDFFLFGIFNGVVLQFIPGPRLAHLFCSAFGFLEGCPGIKLQIEEKSRKHNETRANPLILFPPFPLQ